MKFKLLLIILFSIFGPIKSAEYISSFDLANVCYHQKKFSAAKELYVDFIKSEKKNSKAIAVAHLMLGAIYENDLKNNYYNNMIESYEFAAKQDENLEVKVKANKKLGDLYRYGINGLGINILKAKEKYQYCATQNYDQKINAAGKLGLGDLYYCDYKGIDRDYALAILFYVDCSNQLDCIFSRIRALVQLGDICYLGKGIQVNYNFAKEYYENEDIKKYAKEYPLFYAWANLMLGHIFYYGHSKFGKDLKKAKEHYLIGKQVSQFLNILHEEDKKLLDKGLNNLADCEKQLSEIEIKK